jgi:hypothetical protein
MAPQVAPYSITYASKAGARIAHFACNTLEDSFPQSVFVTG